MLPAEELKNEVSPGYNTPQLSLKEVGYASKVMCGQAAFQLLYLHYYMW